MSASKNAQAITVINLKGGVGKTHTTWLLAGNCEEQGIKVLAIDLDQQGNLTRNLMDNDKNNTLKGSAVLFDPGKDVEPKELIQQSNFQHIDWIRSFDRFRFRDCAVGTR